MTTDAFNEAGLTQRLLDFDREARLLLNGKKPSVSVVILGGSAFILSGLDARITYDIDVLTVPSALVEILHKYDMNTSVRAYADTLPYNYEDRLVTLDFKDTFLQYQRPALEDLIVTKLYALRPPDQEDLKSPEIVSQIDWDLLEHLVFDKDEAQASVLSEKSYSEMVQAYNNYKKEFYNAHAVIS